MARKDSVQQKLTRVRPPRVQLTYEVEKGDAVEQKELPFVVGVIADLVGSSEVEPAKLKDRKFVNIDGDNFDDVMRGMAPRASYRVPNRLSQSGGEFAVNITFSSIDDFRPESVVQQVEPLRKLLEARTKLADLRNKLAGNDKLEDILQEVLTNTEMLAELGAGEKTEE